ncbi:B-box zinc finger protein 22-like [Senna tora]|uniref:B-box zinc finger protein 22-like n=1 Tax=Senna tora TaxID=362788 RepID=A0A834TK42_9FABA|nr:B-box zinc finger protein 22-like [Senna tora]
MKIQCNVCEGAEAKVLCCADEAALCWDCDDKVHAANKLAGKHQRVTLSSSSSSHMPKCDICQETFGYFFCLEDRALLCRKCDVAIHTANSYVSTHQRFLLTGVRVGLETTDPGASSSSAKSQSEEKMSDTKSSSASKKVSSIPESSEYNEVLAVQGGGDGKFPPTKVSYGGGSSAGNISNWPIDEFLGFNEFSQNYNYMDRGPSKADSGKIGDCDSPSLISSEEEIDDDDDCLGRVPDSSWMVPQNQISSPPTASGLYWPKDPKYSSDSAVLYDSYLCNYYPSFEQFKLISFMFLFMVVSIKIDLAAFFSSRIGSISSLLSIKFCNCSKKGGKL